MMDMGAIENRLEWLWAKINELRETAHNTDSATAKDHLQHTADSYQIEFQELHSQYRLAKANRLGN